MKGILAVVGLLVLAVVGYFLWAMRSAERAATSPIKEIATETISRTGDTWHVNFTSRFEAPVDKVYEVFTRPEDSKNQVPENILKSDLLSSGDDKKTVDVVVRLDILPPGFKVQNTRIEYTYFPAEKRITSRTIDFKLADINSEYRFAPSPDGKGTILTYIQTSRDKAPMIVESLQKGALREQFATQVRAASRALGLAPKEAQKQAG